MTIIKKDFKVTIKKFQLGLKLRQLQKKKSPIVRSFNNKIYNKFLGTLIKKGKKSKVKKIFDFALKKVAKKTKKSINFLLYETIRNLTTRVELKRVKFRRSSHLIPFLISRSRQIYLALRWILSAVKTDKKKTSLSNKLSIEIFKIVNHVSCASLNAKLLNNSQAYLNRSNTHFRW